MTLDLAAIRALISQMAGELAGERVADDERLRRALGALRERAQDWAEINGRLAGKGFVGLAAELFEPPDTRRGLPPLPEDHAVVACDGSLIEPDRHAAAYYYVINVGSVVLRYGRAPKAMLQSKPMLGYRPEDVYLALGEREVPLEGGVLRVKRAVAETLRLAELLLEASAETPLVGLQDGILIPWMPEGRGINEADLQEALLKPIFARLGQLKEAGLPIASYISRPRSSEVMNTLRAAICPFPTPTNRNAVAADCRHNCPRRSWQRPAPCDEIAGVTDRRLLGALPLGDGERSALFVSRSRMLEQYLDHRIYFCYVNVGTEIARLEMPEWVARDPAKLDLVHAVAYDQCRKGGGYPRALTEAHEKAVIGVGDRQLCERLVESALAREHVGSTGSEKQQSKRARGV